MLACLAIVGMEGQRIQVVPGPRAATSARCARHSAVSELTSSPPIKRARHRLSGSTSILELKEKFGRQDHLHLLDIQPQMPGPFIRVRVGDTLEVHLKNNQNSVIIHSVNFHAATVLEKAQNSLARPRGGKHRHVQGVDTPAIRLSFAAPSVPDHRTNGMYGLILVEPEGGLPHVDREFYVMQGELYTAKPFGTQGDQEWIMKSHLRAAGVLPIQWRGRRTHEGASAQSTARRNGAHILWRRWSEFFLLVSCHRRDLQ